MATATRLMIANELLLMPDGDACRYELIDGELITMAPSGSEHSAIGLDFGSELRQFVKANDLGRVFGADGGFIISTDPDTVLSPGCVIRPQRAHPGRRLAQRLLSRPARYCHRGHIAVRCLY